MKLKNFYKNVRKDGLKAITPNNQSLLDFTKKILDFSAKGLKKESVIKKEKMNQYF